MELDDVVYFLRAQLGIQLGIMVILPQDELMQAFDVLDGIVQKFITYLLGVMITDFRVPL